MLAIAAASAPALAAEDDVPAAAGAVTMRVGAGLDGYVDP